MCSPMLHLLALLFAASPDLSAACGGKDLVACLKGALALEKSEPERAEALYVEGCRHHEAICSELASFLLNRRAKPDPATAEKVAKASCEQHQNAIACAMRGLALMDLDRHAEAAAANELGCKLGHQTACTNLATALIRGRGMKEDKARARELLQQGCAAYEKQTGAAGDALKDPMVCQNLALALQQGWGGPVDEPGAARAATLACQRGRLKQACEWASRR